MYLNGFKKKFVLKLIKRSKNRLHSGQNTNFVHVYVLWMILSDIQMSEVHKV